MNNLSKLLSLSLVLALGPVAGCVAESSDSDRADFGGGGGKADETNGDGVYAARFMQARCPGAECQGLEVTLINHSETVCPDGTSYQACTVMNPNISWEPTGLSADRIEAVTSAMPYGSGNDNVMTVLLRAHHEGNTFVIDEVWQSGGWDGVTTGEIVGVMQDSDGMLQEQVVNVAGITNLHDLDFDSLPWANEQIDQIYDALPTGVIIAGERYTSNDGTPARSVNQYWTRVRE